MDGVAIFLLLLLGAAALVGFVALVVPWLDVMFISYYRWFDALAHRRGWPR
jgi:hypothetical protein